jgi:Holliday junction resolvasome RuvABC endonuclease subunit
MKILGMDPGSVNFGWALYEGSPKAWGWVKTPPAVNDPAVFLNDILEIFTRTKPDYIVAERFMMRGGSSTIAEPVNLMLGMIQTLAASKGIPFDLITAAQWKNYWRQRDREWTKDILPQLGWVAEPGRAPIHICDAFAMAQYWEAKLDE